MNLRRHSTPYSPPPAEVLSPAELARATQVRTILRLAWSWRLEPCEVKGLLFVCEMIAAGRIGKGDRN